jgi:uncharacterized membrane protein (UPF0127 family)
MQQVLIHNRTRPAQPPIRAGYCSAFLCRLRGLMFKRSLGRDEGILMVQPTSSRLDAAIHMLFMNFDITTVWLDDDLRVVDTRLCRRWRLAYAPAAPAHYVLETHAAHQDHFQAGDQLSMEPCSDEA